MHETAFHFAKFARAAVTAVRGMNQDGSALHAKTITAGGIARTSLPVRSFAVLLEVRRVVGVDDRLISDRNVGEFSISTASVQAVFPGHKVVIVSATSREE